MAAESTVDGQSGRLCATQSGAWKGCLEFVSHLVPRGRWGVGGRKAARKRVRRDARLRAEGERHSKRPGASIILQAKANICILPRDPQSLTFHFSLSPFQLRVDRLPFTSLVRAGQRPQRPRVRIRAAVTPQIPNKPSRRLQG